MKLSKFDKILKAIKNGKLIESKEYNLITTGKVIKNTYLYRGKKYSETIKSS